MSAPRITWTADKLPDEVKDAVNEALKECGEDLLNESGKLVPLLTGILQGSGEVSQDENAIAVNVSYDTPYAKRQHEDTRLRHSDGRQAKYLEKAFNDAKNRYMNWIQRAIKSKLKS